jgi:hypothetical protein
MHIITINYILTIFQDSFIATTQIKYDLLNIHILKIISSLIKRCVIYNIYNPI